MILCSSFSPLQRRLATLVMALLRLQSPTVSLRDCRGTKNAKGAVKMTTIGQRFDPGQRGRRRDDSRDHHEERRGGDPPPAGITERQDL